MITNHLGAQYTLSQSEWTDSELVVTLNIAASSVSEDKAFTCVVSAAGQADQTEIGQLNTYGNTTNSTTRHFSMVTFCSILFLQHIVQLRHFILSTYISYCPLTSNLTLEISSISHDVAAGHPATLVCSVSGVSANDIDLVWLDRDGVQYRDPTNNEDYAVV